MSVILTKFNVTLTVHYGCTLGSLTPYKSDQIIFGINNNLISLTVIYHFGQ